MKHVVWSTLALFLVISGCAGQAELIQEQRNALQELADAHTRLEAEMAVLKDSLKFIDDVDSGQYYRDRRILEQRIDKLEYDLAVCHDSSDIATTEVAVIRADDLFSPASAELSAAGENRLARLADQLARDDHRTIRIEGHSDSVPLGPSLRTRYASNWELSAARAAAVAKELIDRLGFTADRIEVVAFGDSRPVASNQTADGRSANRRVRVALR